LEERVTAAVLTATLPVEAVQEFSKPRRRHHPMPEEETQSVDKPLLSAFNTDDPLLLYNGVPLLFRRSAVQFFYDHKTALPLPYEK
jgi:hypothetical protein